MEASWAILTRVRPCVLRREDKKREGKQRKGEKGDGFVTNTSQIHAKTSEAEHRELTQISLDPSRNIIINNKMFGTIF
jgi:hypothetical protein